MSQALAELRGPVTQEALRLRMAALHGRDDSLLDPARFPRLLRQANDAEIADVRKVGEDDYEISAHRTAALISPSAPATPRGEAPAAAESAAEPSGPPSEAGAEPAGAGAGAGRDNGSRFGVRFRRGSRGSSRPGEIPLIGVVQVETAPEEVTVAAEAAPGPEAEQAPAKKPARTRKAPRKKASAAAATAAAPEGEAATPAKRPRARAKKKAE
jgi:hypothetical protein